MIESTPAGELLGAAEQLYVGIRTSKGPHVTPELFTVRGDHVVCMTAATTLKAKLARRDRMVAVVARAGSVAMAGVGTVEVVDPVRPASALAAPITAGLGAAQFVRDNALELVGAARDALGGRLGLPPPHRVLLVVTLVAALVVEEDEVTWMSGWDRADPGDPGLEDDERVETEEDPEAELDLSEVPAHLATLVEPGDVMLGWMAEDGRALALPARWEGGSSATVSAAMFDATNAVSSSRACVTFDAWSGLGPSGKQGLLLRGSGQARVEDDDGRERVRVTFDIERVTAWDGVENHSFDIDDVDKRRS